MDQGMLVTNVLPGLRCRIRHKARCSFTEARTGPEIAAMRTTPIGGWPIHLPLPPSIVYATPSFYIVTINAKDPPSVQFGRFYSYLIFNLHE